MTGATPYVTPQINALVDNDGARKNQLLNMMFTKVIEEREIKPELKKFFDKNNFLDNKYPMAHNLKKRFEDNNIPTFEYMEEKYSFIPEHTEMTQYDIAELIKEIYVKQSVTLNIINNLQDFKVADMNKMKKVLESCNDTLVEMENFSMASFGDSDRIKNALKRVRDKTDCVRWGNLEGFNRLELRTKMTLGILAASGSGKSLVLEKLHAESKDDIVLHFSLELSEDMFIRRMIVALGWVADDDVEYLSDQMIEHYATKMKRSFPYWHYTTVDTDSSKVNLNKIEKMVKYFIVKYKNELESGRQMKVFLDYMQILDEPLDPMNCRLSDAFHTMAVKYNFLGIVGLQGNDKATEYEKPAETSMIAFVKSLKNGFDVIQSFKAQNIIEQPNITILNSETKKHRTGKFCNFAYNIDHNKTGSENWKLIGKLKDTTKHLDSKIDLINGSHLDYDKDEEVLSEENK